MVQKQPLIFRFACLLLTAFWGSWILLGSFIRFLTSPRKFFYAQNYNKVPDIARNSSLWSFNYATISTPDQQNLKIFYASAGQKGKPLMLLIHGFPECWYSWRFQLKEFSGDFWVVAIDARGYGGSDKPLGLENYALDNLVEDIPALILALGYEKATVVGHDWGGAMTWMFASKYPQMCDKVIILNCPHPLAQVRAFRSNIKQLLASWYMFYFLLPFLPEIIMRSNDFSMLAATLIGKKGGVRTRENLTKEDLDVFKYTLNTWEARRSAHNYIRANFKYKANFPLGKITTPILIVWGEADIFLTKSLAEMSKYYAEQLEIKYIAKASHWVQQDCPQKVNVLMRDFIKA